MTKVTCEIDVLNSESVLSDTECSGIATNKLFLKQLIWLESLKQSSLFNVALYKTEKQKWVKANQQTVHMYI